MEDGGSTYIAIEYLSVCHEDAKNIITWRPTLGMEEVMLCWIKIAKESFDGSAN